MASKPNSNHLLIIQDNQGRKEFALNALQYSIGRDPKCDIRLISHFVSRRHATLVLRQRQDGSYYYRIVDGDAKGNKPSSNGLLIGGRKIIVHDLRNEDQIVFGPEVWAIYFSLGKERETVPSGPLDEWDVTLINPGSRPVIESYLG